ncbi:GNAT family N-acetyltransferase [Candidatus Uabimicrobium sp. HlEnr_7]|uniref:GNAT family N-acetyltransferase n=1 Tax=Candidatus Uabimicrobium helgolandensis TaxID=3095367 RepID=UPI003557C0B7
MQILTSKRLILRRWKPEDYRPFFLLNSDPQVMEFLPKVLSQEESNAMILKIENHFEQRGFGFFACEEQQSQSFIGFVGLSVPQFSCDFTPCVEIGWRIAREYWNRGYATEAASEVLLYARNTLKQKEIVSFTVPNNLPSRRVMEKIGMTYVKNFYHPALNKDHPLCQHVLYKKHLRDI